MNNQWRDSNICFPLSQNGEALRFIRYRFTDMSTTEYRDHFNRGLIQFGLQGAVAASFTEWCHRMGRSNIDIESTRIEYDMGDGNFTGRSYYLSLVLTHLQAMHQKSGDEKVICATGEVIVDRNNDLEIVPVDRESMGNKLQNIIHHIKNSGRIDILILPASQKMDESAEAALVQIESRGVTVISESAVSALENELMRKKPPYIISKQIGSRQNTVSDKDSGNKSWFTVHDPDPDPDPDWVRWSVYLKSEHASLANEISIGDRVFFYEAKTSRQVQFKGCAGRMGVVRFGRVTGTPIARDKNEASSKYIDGEEKLWSIEIPTNAGNSNGYISREKTVETLGYKQNYVFKGFNAGKGIKQIDEYQAHQLEILFSQTTDSVEKDETTTADHCSESTTDKNVDYALLASWHTPWIADHKNWIKKYGSHTDCWHNTIGKENVELLKLSEQKNGHIWMYAYMTANSGGNMRICHRLKLQNIEYTDEPTSCGHIIHEKHPTNLKLSHEGQSDILEGRLRFLITEIHDIEHLDPTEFVTPKGANPCVVRGLNVIEDSLSSNPSSKIVAQGLDNNSETRDHLTLGRDRAAINEGDELITLNSKRYDLDNSKFLYWWNITESQYERAMNSEENVLFKFCQKDSGLCCVVTYQKLVEGGFLDENRKTSRGKNGWGVKVLFESPHLLSFEPANEKQKWRTIIAKWNADDDQTDVSISAPVKEFDRKPAPEKESDGVTAEKSEEPYLETPIHSPKSRRLDAVIAISALSLAGLVYTYQTTWSDVLWLFGVFATTSLLAGIYYKVRSSSDKVASNYPEKETVSQAKKVDAGYELLESVFRNTVQPEGLDGSEKNCWVSDGNKGVQWNGHIEDGVTYLSVNLEGSGTKGGEWKIADFIQNEMKDSEFVSLVQEHDLDLSGVELNWMIDFWTASARHGDMQPVDRFIGGGRIALNSIDQNQWQEILKEALSHLDAAKGFRGRTQPQIERKDGTTLTPESYKSNQGVSPHLNIRVALWDAQPLTLTEANSIAQERKKQLDMIYEYVVKKTG